MNSSLQEHCRRELEGLDSKGLRRRLRCGVSQGTRLFRFDGRVLVNFSSNDYLGLASDPRLWAGVEGGAAEVGNMGAGASRLVSGNHPDYMTLEAELARFKQVDEVLVFGSGYAAAVGTIPALVGKEDFVVMDKLCHASLVDGARLSGAVIRVYPHLNMDRCGELLANCREKAGDEGKILLVTESVFSMDGDLAPLDQLAQLKDQYGAWLMVDEAHGSGVLGREGRGGTEMFCVEDRVDVAMGTLSKAFGCVGGFVGGKSGLKDHLVNRARSLIYSTGLPSVVCRAACRAVRMVREEPVLRERLWVNIRKMAEGLGVPPVSPIFPVIIPDEKTCVETSLRLAEAGFWAPAIRYPTVPRGKARLRISVSAAHTAGDVQGLLEALRLR
ncbi:MAG: 8-amino-7-oxononanoate synthase [Verrucomicrobiae bacterium]|nr:8-amino-7-oxononanoate synthase [Verrucomicrobiae bacterium]